jgi:hypothetical protein
MTLRSLFEYVTNNPSFLVYYFLLIPLICLVLMILINDPNQAIKIKWLFTTLCFMIVIPGIFALTLNVYTFLFERQSVWDFNLVLQALPVVSMGLSLMLIKKTLPFNYIPGFEKLIGLSTVIFALMGIMWFIDRTHIYAFSMIPFSYIIIGFVAIIIFIRFGMSRML